jgi:hypothetical protein
MNTSTSEKLLVYFDDEEHIVRRLGAAVISCWDQLPKPVAAMIIERSAKVFDNDESGQFGQQLKAFLKTHTGEH